MGGGGESSNFTNAKCILNYEKFKYGLPGNFSMNLKMISKSIMETNNNTEIIPFAAVHPTEIIKDEIKARGVSQKELAFRMGMKTSNLSKLLRGENITPAIAAQLELALDIPSDYWLNLQSQYEVDSKNVALRNELETIANSDIII